MGAAEVARAMREVYWRGLTTPSGGNTSQRAPDGLWITPSGLDKGRVQELDVARVRDGDVVHGHPSSELPFHQAVFAARPDMDAVIHAHPPALVAFSVARAVPDTRALAAAWHRVGPVGLVGYALPGSLALGLQVAEALTQGVDAVVLENHGAVVVGRDLDEAVDRLVLLEALAAALLCARRVGPVPSLGFPSAEVGSPAGLVEDPELAEWAARATARGLLLRAGGSLSVRRPDGARITPDHGVRDGLTGGVPLDDLGAPRHAQVHAAVYARHPEVGAIMSTLSPCALAFALAGERLEARTIPESVIQVRDPVSLGGLDEVAGALSPDAPAGLVAGEGAVVLGADLADVLDRAEVLEATARAVLDSRLLGTPSPMSDSVMSELRQAFFPNGGF